MDARKAYRHLIRQGLRAVQYKAPQKHVLRNVLRQRFRTGSPDPVRLRNTVEFMTNAAKYGGMELKILQNMIHVEYSRYQVERKQKKFDSTVYRNYYETLNALNQTLDLAL